MKLSENDARLFFQLMLPLQYYISQTQDLIDGVESFDDFLDTTQLQKVVVRDWLFEHIDIIDEFAAENPFGFGEEEVSIIRSWKQFISGEFFVERLLKKYAVFIKDERVYAVLALGEPFETILQGKPLPVYLQTVLLPFKGRIVYDGVVKPYGMSFGGQIKQVLKKTYMREKENGLIITDLMAPPPETAKPDKQKVSKTMHAIRHDLNEIEQGIETTGMTPLEAKQLMEMLQATAEYARQRVVEPDDEEEMSKKLRKMVHSVKAVSLP
ncbi:MAG: hypothetical protein U5R06_02995 [candidate division KSB1 bacterium]|nr:hypothetical protein [candidate division KSB1 bacterium]